MAWAALAASVCGVPAAAKDSPRPRLSIDPITARTLLAPIDYTRTPPASYRLDPGPEPVIGQGARLSLEVGESTLFAITGRLDRLPGPPGPLEAGELKALRLKAGETGKVYGAGISRKIGGVDIGASYQYSKIRAEQPADDSQAQDDGPGKSHSLRAVARIRFRP